MKNSIFLKGMNKRKILMFFQFLISIGLISYLIFLVDWSRALGIIKDANIVYLIVGFSLLIFGLVFSSLRWCLILKDNDVEFSIFKSYKAYLRGMFYNIFLPGVVGGDIIRIGICRFQTDCELGIATASVLLERISGIFSLFVFLFLSYSIFFDKFLTGINSQFIMYVLIIGLMFVILFILSVLLRYKLMKWLLGRDLNGILKFLFVGIKAFCSIRLKTMLIIMFLSGLFQSFDILACFLFSRAVGIELSLPIFFGIIPLIYFATVLPVSLGGLGVREGTFVFLLSTFGVGITEAITLSFLVYFNKIIYGIVGGIIEFMGSFKMKRANITS